jgi:hypothetical protein
MVNFLASYLVGKGYSQHEQTVFWTGYKMGIGIARAIETGTLDIFINNN